MTHGFRITLLLSCLTLAACNNEKFTLSEGRHLSEDPVSGLPHKSSISKDKLKRIEAVLQEEVDTGVRSGFVAMVAKDGDLVYQTAVGMADRENHIPMESNTRFRIASMTKAVVTVAIMQLVEEGQVLLSDPVSMYIPAFADMRVATSQAIQADGSFATERLKRPITVHHLLTHTAGFGQAMELKTDLDKFYRDNSPYQAEGNLAARIDLLTTFPLYEHPGEKFRYGHGLDVAGRMIEIVTGKTLEAYFQDKIFGPLGMNDTAFFLDESDFDRLAVLYGVDQDGKLSPAASPYNRAIGWMSGGAGLVAPAGDYMRFFMMLLNEGELDGERLLSPISVSLMLQRNIPVSAGYQANESINEAYGETFGLGGYVFEKPEHRGGIGVVGEWGWFGFYDTDAFLSPGNELAVIVMSQQIPSGAPKSRADQLVRAIAYGAVEN